MIDRLDTSAIPPTAQVIPLHTVIELTPTAYGYDEETVTPGPRVTWNPESLPPQN